MKISELKDTFYDSSAKVSDLTRQFSFAGIGVVWALRVGSIQRIDYSQQLIFPLACFVFSLLFDFLQYFYKTIVYYYLNSKHWKEQGDNKAEIVLSEKVNFPTNCLFCLKTMAVLIGLINLAVYLGKQL